jgi:hypothetical protein
MGKWRDLRRRAACRPVHVFANCHNKQFGLLRIDRQHAASFLSSLFASIKKYINMLCLYEPVVYDPGSHFRSKPLFRRIEQTFALSLNDLPIDSGDK